METSNIKHLTSTAKREGFSYRIARHHTTIVIAEFYGHPKKALRALADNRGADGEFYKDMKTVASAKAAYKRLTSQKRIEAFIRKHKLVMK